MKRFKNDLKINDVAVKAQYYSQFKVKCQCGHTLVISPKIGKLLCNHCGNYVYSDKKLEFMEKLNKEMKKNVI